MEMKDRPALNPWFVTGLAEGEGCFTVSFSFRRKLKVGIETRPSFSLSLNQRDLELLDAASRVLRVWRHSVFACGSDLLSTSPDL